MNAKETAFHEAGHAIVAAVLGILRNASTITVIPSRGLVGEEIAGSVSFSKVTGTHDSGKPWSKRYVRKFIIATYAGPAVSQKLNPDVKLLEEGGYNEFDMLGATELKGRFLVPDGSSWTWEYAALYENEQTWRKAVALVEAFWPAITALAKELIKRNTLTGTDAKKILKQATDSKAARITTERRTLRVQTVKRVGENWITPLSEARAVRREME